MIHYVKFGVKGIDDDINQIEPTIHMMTFQHTLSMATPGTDLRIMRILRDASDSSRGEGRHPSPLYSIPHVNTGLVPPTYPLVHNQAQFCSLWLTVNTQKPLHMFTWKSVLSKDENSLRYKPDGGLQRSFYRKESQTRIVMGSMNMKAYTVGSMQLGLKAVTTGIGGC